MTDTPNRVTEIEEVVREHTELIKTKFRYDHSAEKDWLRTKLTTLVAEAEARGETKGEARGRQQAVEYIKDNMMFGRDISKNMVFDTNEFTDLLVAALTTEGK